MSGRHFWHVRASVLACRQTASTLDVGAQVSHFGESGLACRQVSLQLRRFGFGTSARPFGMSSDQTIYLLRGQVISAEPLSNFSASVSALQRFNLTLLHIHLTCRRSSLLFISLASSLSASCSIVNLGGTVLQLRLWHVNRHSLHFGGTSTVGMSPQFMTCRRVVSHAQQSTLLLALGLKAKSSRRFNCNLVYRPPWALCHSSAPPRGGFRSGGRWLLAAGEHLASPRPVSQKG